MLNEITAATHSTAPWYIAIPIVIVTLGIGIARRRRGGGRGGPFGRGPFQGPGNGL
jgi:hypothetical protein